MKKRKFPQILMAFGLLTLFALGSPPVNAQEALQGQIETTAPKDARLKKLAEEKERRQIEATRRKEEKSRKLTEAKIKEGLELKAKRQRAADLELRRQMELQEQAKQKEEELSAKREESERKKEDKQRLISEREMERQQKLKTRQEELDRQEEERQNRSLELQLERHRKLKARQEGLARQKEEKEKKLAEVKSKKDEEIRRKELEARQKKEEEQRRIAQAEERKQKELSREKEGRLKQLRELKDKLEEEVAAKKKELTRKRQEGFKQDTRAKARQEEADRKKEEEKEKFARIKAELDTELKARQEALGGKKQGEAITKKQRVISEKEKLPWDERLAQQEIERQERALGQEAELQQGLKAKREDLLRKKEELNEKIQGMKKTTIQEKAVTEEMLKKQKEDEAKVARIENLWMKARRLYSQGMYEEAIKDFEYIIKLEGNPRIKYTPQAKEYIEKAKEKIEDVKKEKLSKEVGNIEGDMLHEVLKRQIPPYIEPPAKMEKSEDAPLIEPPAIRKKLKEKKVTMDFDKVDLKSVILFLSQESGINFVTSNRVLELGLKVTTRFNDTPLDEVVKYIIKSLGLVYRIDKEVVWIAHPEEVAQEPLETRVYYLTKGGGLFSEFSSVSGGTDTSLGSSSAQISKIATLEDTLKEVVPWPQDAKLTFDKRINALIVRNTPQNLQALEDMLYNLDVTPLQILIEARFLEVNVTDTEELGLEWKVANSDFPLKKATEAGGTKGFSHGVGKDSGVDFTAFSRAAEGFNLTYKGLLTTPQFEAVLHALEESKKTKTLSSPRITTLNNQMATIKVVDEWLYPTRYEYEVVQTDVNGDGDFDDAGETTYKNVPKDFLRRDIGILLKVIPSAGADKKTISLSLIPEVSEAVADFFSYTGDVKLPKFTSRNLSTSVVVNSGETVVLGGLIKESRTKTLTKVPFMGDIPFIGAFFRKNADSIERKNLLIFVTARIISPSGEEVVVQK